MWMMAGRFTAGMSQKDLVVVLLSAMESATAIRTDILIQYKVKDMM